MTLSLCMIVKDEEANLPRCLGSVQAVVDEMVVLDTGSRDRTPDIAKEFGAKVHFWEWQNDFAAARNEALRYVQGDWVLVLDADEVLTLEIVPSLKQAIQSDRHLLINLIRQEVGAEQSPYSLVSRLFRNHPDISFSRPYHALVDDSISLILSQEPHWQIRSLPDVAILHEGYQAEAIASRDKLAKAQAAMESFFAKHPTDPYVCSKLGALYVQVGEPQRGVDLLSKGLKSSQLNPAIAYELHYHLGIAYSRLSNPTQAAVHYQKATQQPIFPKLKLGAYNNFGNLLKAHGYLREAKAAYHSALQVDPNFAIGYYNLGMTFKAMGNLNEAIAAYKRAIQLNPSHAQAHQNLGVALWNLGKVSESITAFQKAIALHQQRNPLEAERLRQGLKDLGLQL